LDWLRRPERVSEAGMMAFFTGGFLTALALLCMMAVAGAAAHREGVGQALASTVGVAALAGLHFWIGSRTRARRLWAVWAGLLAALLLINEIIRFLVNHGFQFEGFDSVVCFPLFLLVAIQLATYVFALHAYYGARDLIVVRRPLEEMEPPAI
jgi:hypothetical protein